MSVRYFPFPSSRDGPRRGVCARCLSSSIGAKKNRKFDFGFANWVKRALSSRDRHGCGELSCPFDPIPWRAQATSLRRRARPSCLGANRDSKSIGMDIRFFSPASHADALISLATSSLAGGDARSAFAAADRRCRIFPPGARDLLTRAEASRILGQLPEALSDLTAAADLDPTDTLVNRAIIRWGPEANRLGAAERILASDNPDNESIAAALEQYSLANVPIARRLTLIDGRVVAGWAVWQGRGALSLRIDTEAGEQVIELEGDQRHTLARFGSAASIDFESSLGRIRSITLTAADGSTTRNTWTAVTEETGGFRRERAPDPNPAASEVLVIVPVFADLPLTRACLEAAIAEKAEVRISILVVDDCAPDPALQHYLQERSRQGAFTLIRNSQNLGFVGSVNEALKRHDGQDILLLNADAIMPTTAIERLRKAAYSAPDIGTVTPLSNNGEFTSFPRPFVANPLPSTAEIARIDTIAAAVNSGATISIPNGIGFCLYIRRDCFQAVGLLSNYYQRGYGEDIELCLAARERGFVNVCATDVFVGHAGSRSFGEEKRALVMRNLKVLERRFPTYRIECAAFLAADPLAEARSAIERVLPSNTLARLIVQASHRAQRPVEARARQLQRAEFGGVILVLRPAASNGEFEIRSLDGSAPQALKYNLHKALDRSALADRIARYNIDRIEVADPSEAEQSLLDVVFGAKLPIDFLFSDLRWVLFPWSAHIGVCRAKSLAAPCIDCEAEVEAPGPIATAGPEKQRILRIASSRAESVIATDPLSAAIAGQVFAGRPIRCDARSTDRSASNSMNTARPCLAVLAPTLSPAVDRLLQAIGRANARSPAEAPIIIIGACIDDLAVMAAGNLHVCGPTPPIDYERLIAQYEVGFVLSPYRTGGFWVFDDLPSPTRLPRAYFDWSFGAMPVKEFDLGIDPRTCDERAAALLLSWWAATAGNAGGLRRTAS